MYVNNSKKGVVFKMEKWFLKPNLVLEPLIGDWYAWPHLVAPHTLAMNVAHSQIKIMASFVQTPMVHQMALKNPNMRGGPFLDLPISRASEIKELLEKTIQRMADHLAFAEAIKALRQMLSSQAVGGSLDPLYRDIPDALKGFVELTYDLNHRPSFRFIEGLLYHSHLYNPALQSISLFLTETHHRPFVFSTPRISEKGRLHLDIPFHSKAIDALFEMRHTPKTFSQIKDILALKDDDEALFQSFLTKDSMSKGTGKLESEIRVRYLGHASVLVETPDTSILVDPVVGYKTSDDQETFSFSDLPESIDFVLITHTHADHVIFETLLQLRHRIKCIVVPKSNSGFLEDPSLKLILQNTGFDNVREIDEMETLPIDSGSIMGIPFLGEHGDLSVRCKSAYRIAWQGKSILCVADSANLDEKMYERIQAVIGDIDVLFLGMECDGAPMSWVYGPLFGEALSRKMDHERRLSGSNCEEGMRIIHRLGCKKVFVYAMGQEPWLQFLTSIEYTETSKPIVESNQLLAECKTQGIEAERLLGIREVFL